MDTLFRLDTKEPHLLSLVILCAFASMGAVLMTPALPEIMPYFHVTEGQAQLTVTLFMIGYALGQLIYGPLANRFGRKPAFYIGISIATVGSIFSILAAPIDSFWLLLLGRLFEALGASAGLVTSFTVIADFYYPAQSRRITSYLIMAFAIVPGISVFVGGFLTQYFDWKSCFYFLFVYGLFLFYPAYKLPETLKEKHYDAIKINRIHRSYREVFGNKPLVRFALLYGFSGAIVYVFSADAPFIGIHMLDLSTSQYGMLALLPTIGMLIGGIFSAKASDKLSAQQLLWLGVSIEFLFALIMLVCFLSHRLSIYTLLAPMFFIYFGHALIASNASSSAMYFALDKANGSAVMNFICLTMVVLGTVILAVSHVHAAAFMPLIFVVLTVLLGITLWTTRVFNIQ